MNENIKNIAEIIAVSIVGDTADDEDIQSSIPLATALYKAGYRKQEDTVKEFAEKVKKELFAKCVIIQSVDNPQEQDMDSAKAFAVIDELAKQFGKGD